VNTMKLKKIFHGQLENLKQSTSFCTRVFKWRKTLLLSYLKAPYWSSSEDRKSTLHFVFLLFGEWYLFGLIHGRMVGLLWPGKKSACPSIKNVLCPHCYCREPNIVNLKSNLKDVNDLQIWKDCWSTLFSYLIFTIICNKSPIIQSRFNVFSRIL